MPTRSVPVAVATVAAGIRQEIRRIDPYNFDHEVVDKAIYLASLLPIDPAEIPAVLAELDHKLDQATDRDDVSVQAATQKLAALKRAVFANMRQRAIENPAYLFLFKDLGYDLRNQDEAAQLVLQVGGADVSSGKTLHAPAG